MAGIVLAVCRSVEKGTVKLPIPVGHIVKDFGLEGDAHGGDWHRQVSLLAEESVQKMRNQGFDLGYGDFAENITTKGITLFELPIGTILKLGEEVLLEVTQIGKTCHHDCEVYHKIGACVMPQEGIFTRVLQSGIVKAGDKIQIFNHKKGC